MRYKLLLISILLCFVSNGVSASLKSARELYLDGKFAEALPLFEQEYKKKKKDGSINHWIGVCLYELGRGDEAIKYLEYAHTRKVLESSHYLARIYFDKYDFANSVDMYETYIELLEADEKDVPNYVAENLRRAKLAESMLDHVEKITIIDSIAVDKEDFFKFYRISPETGTFVSNQYLPVKLDAPSVGFLTQSEDRIMWAMEDENNVTRLCESVKLINGRWDTPQFLDEELNYNGDANYPFMMQDGATLYYASNGDGSIGGYDIFMTRVDAETGEYYKSQNIGMPYNSVYDDYLLVLDDASGLGWWATDRNNIPGKVTIYVFVRNDIRENYNEEEPNLVSYAKILNYRESWGDNDYIQLRNKIYDVNTNAGTNTNDFVFNLKKGVVYTSYADFKNEEAADLMEELVKLNEKYSSMKTSLSRRRCHYNMVNDELKISIKNEILNSEKELDELKGEIFKIENQVRKLELNN